MDKRNVHDLASFLDKTGKKVSKFPASETLQHEGLDHSISLTTFQKVCYLPFGYMLIMFLLVASLNTIFRLNIGCPISTQSRTARKFKMFHNRHFHGCQVSGEPSSIYLLFFFHLFGRFDGLCWQTDIQPVKKIS